MTELEETLSHSFADKALLARALTHASRSAHANNERLEFLGDRVLGLIIAERLFAEFPDDAEGALALKYNALVRGEACARAAEAAGLGKHLILAPSEAGSGGRKKTVVLGGACEAVIAALYLDGGLACAKAFIEHYWTGAFAALGHDMRDAKTMLQEWAQGGAGKGAGAPQYRHLNRSGPDHAPQFSVEVRVQGHDPENGAGGSKRDAEQDAARRLLMRLGLWQG